MIPALLFSLVYFIPGFWLLFLWQHSRNPDNHISTVGTLTRHNSHRNVQTRFGFDPILTSYTYSYTVGGKTYRFKSNINQTKRHLPKKVTIIYLKACPRCAGIGSYRNDMLGFGGALCLLGGAFWMLLSVFNR